MTIKKVGVVGCGLMGAGIAQVCAQSGYSTVVREVSEELLRKGMGRIEGFLAKAVEKGKLSAADKEQTLSRLKGTVHLKDLADCDLVIEAAIENMAEKKKIFSELDKLCPKHTLLASNTSSLSVTEMACATQRPDRVEGLHFFNPVPIMKLVEMVRTELVSDQTHQALRAFAETLGKTVIVAKDSPGFIVNLLLVPYLLDAVRAVENGVATQEDIDAGMKIGCGLPMGPITLLDFVGLDTTLYIADIMYEQFKDPKYAAPPLLRRMVLAGHNGQKAGRGFYDYPQARKGQAS
jgi:3-hydroxybutyryl-CoA dehydrogenase